ncbi:hypothetical protein G7Y79_00064g094020 [Physcia stellaris]|nr:hypothetical protein G7Y79_00064g094020 [Physcia stellaris]
MARKKGRQPLQKLSSNAPQNPTEKDPQQLKVKDYGSKDTSLESRSRKAPISPESHSSIKRPKTLAGPLSPPRSHLDRLPPEILHAICEQLFEDDIPALRLQCKYLCEAATPHFLHSVDARFKKTSIESLLALSKHPILSHNVETISYEPNMVQKKSRLQWEKGSSMVGFSRRIHDFPHPPKQSASEREWRLFHRTSRAVIRHEMEQKHTQKELDLAWPIYQRYLQEQDDMIRQDYACQDLLQAFQGFPNLSAIHINYGWGLWPGYETLNPFDDGLCKATSHNSDAGDTVRGLKELMPLLRMLCGARINLLSFRVGCLNWRFFERCGNDGEHADFFEKLKQMVACLKDFKLVITTWSDFDTDDAEIYEEEVIRCREYLANGLLGRLLAAAPDLRKLAINFDEYEQECPINFRYIVLDTYWSHLHTIDLDSVDTHEEDWMLFFERHASTIKCLSLSMVRLLEGEWADVLERMQGLLDLDEVHFGDLFSDRPWQYWALGPRGYTSSRDDSAKENQLQWALEGFMVHGGECPLRDELSASGQI